MYNTKGVSGLPNKGDKSKQKAFFFCVKRINLTLKHHKNIFHAGDERSTLGSKRDKELKISNLYPSFVVCAAFSCVALRFQRPSAVIFLCCICGIDVSRVIQMFSQFAALLSTCTHKAARDLYHFINEKFQKLRIKWANLSFNKS